MDRVETIKSWYKDWLEKIQSVHSIFIDTFGEERVDLQDMPSEEAFVHFIGTISSSTMRQVMRDLSKPTIPGTLSFRALRSLEEADFERYSGEIRLASAYLIKPTIIVHFPEFIIENEVGNQHTIKDFFARVVLSGEGLLIDGPKFNRTTYTPAELRYSYIHSHISGIHWDSPQGWRTACFGSGPITSTMAGLYRVCSWEDWTLFTVQLDQYVHVESGQGGPYKHISSLGVNSREYSEVLCERGFRLRRDLFSNSLYSDGMPYLGALSSENWKAFTHYVCNNFSRSKLFITYEDNLYSWGSSLQDTVLAISALFREWFNDSLGRGDFESTGYGNLWELNIINPAILRANKILFLKRINSMSSNYPNLEGTPILTFRGNSFAFRTEGEVPLNQELPPNVVWLLNTVIVQEIISAIVLQINIHYGNQGNPTYTPEGRNYQV